MKNSVRHLVLGLAGIACVFALDSCAPRVAEKPKVEVQKVKESGPRCTRDVVNELPGKFESLSCMFFINNEYVVTTWRYEDETEPAFYKLNLKDLTLVPWQIGAKDKDIRFWEHYDKTTLFFTKTNDKYFDMVISRLEKQIGVKFKENIVLRRDYATSDFIKDYNSFKGNAYGLANTLSQTAVLKPKMINKKVKNLFYTGQLTVPGPGVPPCLISRKLVADQVLKYLNKN